MAAVGGFAAGCGSFEDPAIVLDLRVIAMQAEPTEYVIPFDPSAPPDPSTIDLEPFWTCAVVADPAEARTLDWSMTICAANIEDGGRCRTDHPALEFASGVMGDPETASLGDTFACAEYQPDTWTVVLLQDAIEEDPLAGFSGIDLEVMLRVVPTGGDEAQAVYAAKRVRFAAKIPETREPNENPWLEQVDWDTGGPNPVTLPMPLGRCADLTNPNFFNPMRVLTTETLYLMPQEPEGVRETYVVPTFDGGAREFTENLGYQWLAGDGEFSVPFTGGPKDPFGNSPPLHTEWTPPTNDQLGGADWIDVPIWVVQRDERLGSEWYMSCVRVERDDGEGR
jgi:hypothetical protein